MIDLKVFEKFETENHLLPFSASRLKSFKNNKAKFFLDYVLGYPRISNARMERGKAVETGLDYFIKNQNKKIVVIKPSIDNRYSNEKIITHNDLSHECYAMNDWATTLENFIFEKNEVDMVFLDEIQFMDTKDTLSNVEIILNKGIDVVCAGLDQDSRGKPWETSSMLLGLSDKIVKIYGFCNVCGLEATKTFRKTSGGQRTQVGAANIYEPRCLKHWEPR